LNSDGPRSAEALWSLIAVNSFGRRTAIGSTAPLVLYDEPDFTLR